MQFNVAVFGAILAIGSLYSAAAGAHCLDPKNMRVGPGFTDGATIWLPSASGAGTDALELTTGKLLFRVPEAAQPIGLHQGHLVAVTQAQRDREPFPVRVAVFDGSGKRLLLSKALALPAWVASPQPPYSAEFRPLYDVRGGKAVIDWMAMEFIAGKKPGERDYPRRRPALDKLTTVDLLTGQLISINRPIWPQPSVLGVSPPSYGLIVSVHCDRSVGDSWRLGNRQFSIHRLWNRGERRPHALALTEWHPTTKKELRQIVLVGCPVAGALENRIQLSPDWRHLSIWGRVEPHDTYARLAHDYLVYDSQTGALVACMPWSDHNPDGTFNSLTVAADRIIRIVEGKTEKKLQVYSFDGQLAWERKL